MADQSIHHAFSSELDVSNPEFRRSAQLRAFRTQREILETVAATKKTIAVSKELMAQADRMLAKK